MNERTEIIILGGGLVGLTLGIALDAHGLSSVIIDPADPAEGLKPGFDGRASAVASAPGRLLNAIGVGSHLAGQGNPIDKIAVRDGMTADALWFDSSDDGEPLGHMFENRVLRAALQKRAAEATQLRLLAPATPLETERTSDGVRVTLADGRSISGALLIGAEGRRSPSREAAGINAARWSYDHVAMIATVEHAVGHGNIAHEIFYPAGPLAILPLLPGNRSCVVWTVRRADAPAMLALPERAFLAELERLSGDILGATRLIAPRSSYPLEFHHAARIVNTRLALVGDAAHGIHPIAGQGVNVGFRDVAALVEVLVDGARLGLDLGDAQLLDRYDRWRSLDTFMVAGATDALTRLFGVGGPIVRAARRFGLRSVEKMPALKRRFIAEARGESGTLPKLLQGIAV